MANELEKDENKVNHLVENLESVGQVVLGENRKNWRNFNYWWQCPKLKAILSFKRILHHETKIKTTKTEETEND